MKTSSSKAVSYVLAHDLLNRLSVIIGNCDLATERIQAGSDFAIRLAAIRNAAEAMTSELKTAIANGQQQAEVSEGSDVRGKLKSDCRSL